MSAAPSADPVPRLWATPVEDVLAELDVAVAEGLSAEEARARLDRFGPNEVSQQEGRSLWAVALDQFLSPIVYILVAAGVAALVAGEVVEAVAVLIAVLVNAVIGFVTELRAKQSVDSLREHARPRAARPGPVHQQARVGGDGRLDGAAAGRAVRTAAGRGAGGRHPTAGMWGLAAVGGLSVLVVGQAVLAVRRARR